MCGNFTTVNFFVPLLDQSSVRGSYTTAPSPGSVTRTGSGQDSYLLTVVDILLALEFGTKSYTLYNSCTTSFTPSKGNDSTLGILGSASIPADRLLVGVGCRV